MSRSFLIAAVCLLALVAVSVQGSQDAAVSQEHESFLFQSNAANQGALLDEQTFNSTQLQAWTLYKQCGQSWSNNRLGTANGVTICSAGCAMCSVAMMLRTKGKNVDPASLNNWLVNNGGYVQGDLIVWGSVAPFGIRMLNYYRGRGSMSQDSLRAATRAGQGVVVNVRNGGHWVLVTGWIDGNTYAVNDPGYAVNSYQYGDMSNFVQYSA